MNFKSRQKLVRISDSERSHHWLEGFWSCNGHSDRAVFKLQAQIQIGFILSSVKALFNGAKMPCKKYHFVDIGNGMKEMVLSKSSISCTLKCMKVKYVYVALTEFE